MPLDLDDGYTLEHTTRPLAGSTVTFRYRPALWPALTEFNRKLRTPEEVDATAAIIVAHLISWDVTLNKKPAPITAEVVKKLPEPILNEIYFAVSQWAPQKQVDAEGNSGPGSA